MAKIRVGDIGTVIELTISDQDGIVNLIGASIKNFKFEDSAAGTFVKAASFSTDGSDGKLKYAFIASDLDMPGAWKVQAEITLASGSWISDSYAFTVYDPDIV